jgi:hypothetical protein
LCSVGDEKRKDEEQAQAEKLKERSTAANAREISASKAATVHSHQRHVLCASLYKSLFLSLYPLFFALFHSSPQLSCALFLSLCVVWCAACGIKKPIAQKDGRTKRWKRERERETERERQRRGEREEVTVFS